MQIGAHFGFGIVLQASLAQLVEHALRKRMIVGSIPTGGFLQCIMLPARLRQILGRCRTLLLLLACHQ